MGSQSQRSATSGRTPGGEDRRPAQGHAAARHQEGRYHRRRHDGRRHHDEFLQGLSLHHRRCSRKRSTAVWAWCARIGDVSAAKGRFKPEQVDQMMGPITCLNSTRACRLRSHHRGLREYGRQEGHLRQARQDRKARRHSGVGTPATSTSTRLQRRRAALATCSERTSRPPM